MGHAMFEDIQPAPPDPILGLTEAFLADPNPEKINLGVGVYKDEQGRTPVLDAVKHAERIILESESSKSYKPMSGDPEFARVTQAMLFGDGAPAVTEGRVQTAHTPGGTGALRVAGDYLHAMHPGASIWVSTPTWANHKGVFTAAGLPIKEYRYFDAQRNALDEAGMLEDLAHAKPGDTVLIHACCHNPTGVDLTDGAWAKLCQLLVERQLLPVVDFAYQGFGEGIEPDAQGLRLVTEHVGELLVCSSYSKNFGLYNERVGALSVVARSPAEASNVFSQVKLCIRRNYSNPPAHGAAIVMTILQRPELREQWEAELAGMRNRINGMRQLLTRKLDERGVQLSPEGNGFIARQHGMFSFSGLTPEQVNDLREQDAIYIVGSGRINVAGISEQNADRLTDAIARVVA